jgi:hypothetical protein
MTNLITPRTVLFALALSAAAYVVSALANAATAAGL